MKFEQRTVLDNRFTPDLFTSQQTMTESAKGLTQEEEKQLGTRREVIVFDAENNLRVPRQKYREVVRSKGLLPDLGE